jgi:hypothetical protein
MKISNTRKKEAEQVFGMWKASLADKPRGHKHLSENFEDLFFDLHRLQLPYDLAYEYLERAYGAHFPSNATIKWQYKQSAWAKQAGSEEDFSKQWRTLIVNKATTVFHTYFEIPFDDGKSAQDTKREKAKVKRSAQVNEYLSNFEPVDMDELDRMIEQAKNMANEEDDLESFYG